MTAPPRGNAAPAVPALDGLRGAAIVFVILWHVASTMRFPSSALGPLSSLVLAGWSGVDLFFGLSGFLITKLILDEEAATGRLRLGAFYVRRALRILPPFLMAALLALVVLPRTGRFPSVPVPSELPSGWALASILTYWSNYYYALGALNPPGAIGVLWSLCVEEHFYLLWPSFLYCVRGTRRRLAVAAGACVVLPLVRWLSTPRLTIAAVHILSHTRLDSILWGALAALAFEAGLLSPRRRSGLLLTALVALAATGAAGQLSANPTPAGHAVVLSILACAAASLSVCVTASPAGALARALSFAPLCAIGRVSYGMYLFHFEAIDLVAPGLIALYPRPDLSAFVAAATVATATAYGVALLSYHAYERRFLALKHRFTPPRRPEPRVPPPRPLSVHADAPAAPATGDREVTGAQGRVVE